MNITYHNHKPRPGKYRCGVCARIKAWTDFHKDRTRYNGLASRCKACESQRTRDPGVETGEVTDA